MRTIYLESSCARHTYKWFIAGAPNSADEGPRGETVPRASAFLVVEPVKTSLPDPPHRPWLVPGAGKL
jgi:hypothetical protein